MRKKSKKNEVKMINRDKIYSIACILLIIDQSIKLLIRSKEPLLEEIEEIPGFFSIYHIENKGAAFSIFNGATIVLIILSVLVLAFLHYYVLTEKTMTNWRVFSLGIIIGGILGNLIDRILYGAVIDYLSFDLFGYGFPVFNIADIGITIGFVLLAINILRRDSNEFKDSSKNQSRNKN